MGHEQVVTVPYNLKIRAEYHNRGSSPCPVWIPTIRDMVDKYYP